MRPCNFSPCLSLSLPAQTYAASCGAPAAECVFGRLRARADLPAAGACPSTFSLSAHPGDVCAALAAADVPEAPPAPPLPPAPPPPPPPHDDNAPPAPAPPGAPPAAHHPAHSAFVKGVLTLLIITAVVVLLGSLAVYVRAQPRAGSMLGHLFSRPRGGGGGGGASGGRASGGGSGGARRPFGGFGGASELLLDEDAEREEGGGGGGGAPELPVSGRAFPRGLRFGGGAQPQAVQQQAQAAQQAAQAAESDLLAQHGGEDI
jgi:hypothetical protein